MFNHKEVVSKIDFAIGSRDMVCNCVSSPYNYGPAGHVVTGNLRIVDNRHIRQVLIKGPSYREQNGINWNRIRTLLLDAVRTYKKRWAKKEHFDVRLLNEWYCKISDCINNRINVLKRKKSSYKKRQVLK